MEDYKGTLRNIEFLNLALNYCVEVDAGTNCFYIENKALLSLRNTKSEILI